MPLTAGRAGRGCRAFTLILIALLSAACGSGGSDNHPLMWQGAPPVGLIKEHTGGGPDPVVHRVTANAGPGGIVIPAETTAVHGDASQFTVVADPGYSVEEVVGCGGSRVGGSQYVTAAVTAPCAVTATFAIESYTVTTLVSSDRGGSVSGDGLFEYGAQATVTATPRPGVPPDPDFAFVNWTEAGRVVSDDEVYTFEVRGDRTLSANFATAKNAASVRMPPAGRVALFEAHHAAAGLVFASTAEIITGDGNAGIWRSADAGEGWVRTSETPATFIAIASSDPALVIAGHASGYLISTDGGLTWIAGTIAGPGGVALAPNNAAAVTAADGIYVTVAAVAGPGLYRSLDGGATWQQVFTASQAGSLAGAQLRHVDVSPADPRVIHAVTGGNQNLWRSVDAAASFLSIRDGIAVDQPLVFVPGLRVNPLDPEQILVENHVSLNGGADWASIVLPPRTVEQTNPLGDKLFEVEIGQDVVSPRNTVWLDGRLMRIEGDRLVVSGDGGASWVELLTLIGDTGDYDTGRIFLAEDALYLQLTGGPNLVHRVSLTTIREALETL